MPIAPDAVVHNAFRSDGGVTSKTNVVFLGASTVVTDGIVGHLLSQTKSRDETPFIKNCCRTAAHRQYSDVYRLKTPSGSTVVCLPTPGVRKQLKFVVRACAQASVAVLSIDANEDMDKEFGTLVAQEYGCPGRKALARDHAFIAMCMHIKKIALLVFNVRKGKLDKVAKPIVEKLGKMGYPAPLAVIDVDGSTSQGIVSRPQVAPHSLLEVLDGLKPDKKLKSKAKLPLRFMVTRLFARRRVVEGCVLQGSIDSSTTKMLSASPSGTMVVPHGGPEWVREGGTPIKTALPGDIVTLCIHLQRRRGQQLASVIKRGTVLEDCMPGSRIPAADGAKIKVTCLNTSMHDTKTGARSNSHGKSRKLCPTAFIGAWYGAATVSDLVRKNPYKPTGTTATIAFPTGDPKSSAPGAWYQLVAVDPSGPAALSRIIFMTNHCIMGVGLITSATFHGGKQPTRGDATADSATATAGGGAGGGAGAGAGASAGAGSHHSRGVGMLSVSGTAASTRAPLPTPVPPPQQQM